MSCSLPCAPAALLSLPAAAFGLKGGEAAYLDWASNIDVPGSSMASLNDAQCTARCMEPAAAADPALEEPLPAPGGSAAGGAEEAQA